MHNKPYQKTLFIFRRDLRIPDNTGLIHALRLSETVIPIFIFDSIQVGLENEYRSNNALQFMVESLKELEHELKKKDGRLYLFYGKTISTIKKLLNNHAIDALFFNYDYTPFAMKRDRAIETMCKTHKIAVHGFHDELLIGDPSSILTNNHTPYGVYSPFYTKASQKEVPEPIARVTGSWHTNPILEAVSSSIYKKIVSKENSNIKVHGGRKNALKILNSLKTYKEYNTERNFPALDATTHLSASHKFCTVSIRESYHTIKTALGTQTQLLKELYWRDFFTYVAFHSPHVFGNPYQHKYKNLAWSTNKKDFERWCTGLTGFPIVDAGMRQLNRTGWMHNRVRMIVSSFLIKDLHINWLWGEKYFAQQLVDYDPAVNNGNWQWAASTGCDAQPYFRIFNPWTQQRKFDPDCAYIKKWIPELEHVSNQIINNWFKHKSTGLIDYPQPMVDHAQERKRALEMYQSVS